MKNVVLSVLAVLALSTASFAADDKNKTDVKVATNVTDCTGDNSLGEILFGGCNLVKGSDPYGVAGMNGLESVSISSSGGGGTTTVSGF